MNYYKVLNRQIFTFGNFSLVPIRFEDRYDIMQWRNEQIYHLRQNIHLTKEDQDAYFQNVVAKLFCQEKPNQILFSFLEDGLCLGYGGLVHINWVDLNAEVSFIMKTDLEITRFQEIWISYLKMLDEVAFGTLELHKIFTYAFDLRPHLYETLIKANYEQDARLKEHAIFNSKAIDVVIHSKINNNLKLRKVNENDIEITYAWALDEKVRQFSFSKGSISYEEHNQWFNKKLKDPSCYFYILTRGAEKVGSIRVDYNSTDHEGIISYLVGSEFHGKGYGTEILQLLEKKMKIDVPDIKLKGLVMESNIASLKIFEKLGYHLVSNQQGLLTYLKTIN